MALTCSCSLFGCADPGDPGGGSDSGGDTSGGTTAGSSSTATTDPTAGTEGGSGDTGTIGDPPLWSCLAPYEGPMAGPRMDGPDNPSVSSCEALSDALILERYADPSMKVPKGFFYENTRQIVGYFAPCSGSEDETADNASAELTDVEVESTNSTDYFYEASVCDPPPEPRKRTVYRNLRCDYFDGTTLAGAPHETPDELAFLASLLWFAEQHDTGGAQLVAVVPQTDAQGFSVELCTTDTVFGDFGLCDEVALRSTVYEMTQDGAVSIGTTETVRMIEGQCH